MRGWEGREGVPSIVVDLVAIARGVDDVQAQAHAVFLDDCRVSVSIA